MAAQSKWLLFAGLLAASGAALYLGVSPLILLIVGFVLLCPLGMYFGMGKMHGKREGGAGHDEMSGLSKEPMPKRRTEDEMSGNRGVK